MFVSSFVLDRVDRVELASKSGEIPEEWMAMGG
jgi:hypothetical protein